MTCKCADFAAEIERERDALETRLRVAEAELLTLKLTRECETLTNTRNIFSSTEIMRRYEAARGLRT